MIDVARCEPKEGSILFVYVYRKPLKTQHTTDISKANHQRELFCSILSTSNNLDKNNFHERGICLFSLVGYPFVNLNIQY